MARRLANPAAYGVASGTRARPLGPAVLRLRAEDRRRALPVLGARRLPRRPRPRLGDARGRRQEGRRLRRHPALLHRLRRRDASRTASASRASSGTSFLAFFGPVLFVLAAASILFGGVAAVSRDDFDGLLAYSSIGQVGFVVLPLAVAAHGPRASEPSASPPRSSTRSTTASRRPALPRRGTCSRRGRHDALRRTLRPRPTDPARSPSPSSSATLSLIGIPPLVGFFAKFLVFQTTADAAAAGEQGAALALALSVVGAILTIAYFTRAWNRGFWGDVTSRPSRHGRYSIGTVGRRSPSSPALLLVVGHRLRPGLRAANAAAHAALAARPYVDAVLGGGSA